MKIKEVLAREIELIKPSREVVENIEKIAKEFCRELNAVLKKRKIDADVFIGGSLAKNTIVKKHKYDVDIFVRFDKKYRDKELSGLLGQVLKNAKKVHGSRDYYQINKNVLIEVIPVLKIKKPEDAENVTDLSYFHVNYVVRKIKKNKKLADEIRLAKTFCYAQNCYGAESYIHGFSGYALELLICYYGSFEKFIRGVLKTGNIKKIKGGGAKTKQESSESFEVISNKTKIIIDSEKLYKNKQEILIEMNESKLQSPVVLVDPTFKERNAAAGLNYETFEKFKENCKRFLKAPSQEFFNRKDIGSELKKKFGKDLIVISVKTGRQAGVIAGSKSKKFFDFFVYNLRKEFEIKEAEFDYDENKNIAKFYFVVRKKGVEVVKGPPINSIENLKGFKKAHPDAFIKKGFAYARVSHNLDFKRWFKKFLDKEKKVMEGMDIKGVGIL